MIVAALKQEVEGLPNQILLTGVGKINATKVLTDYIINNRSNDNVIVLGDFNNTGSQSIVNPNVYL